MRFRYKTEENGRPIKKAAVYTQNEHRINFTDVDSQAVYVTERLQANGYETYIVGGAVRDLILGKKPKDFDIATSASPSRIKKIFRNSRIIGRRFRLVHVFFGSKIIEVSTFRSMTEGSTGNTFGTVEEDVRRRDFSLNALFYDPQKQVVIDYVGGMKDMRKRVIRPVIDLDRIFTDDPVRMIRAAKYSAATGFRLPLSLKWRIRKHAELLASVSPSRLTEEIFKIIHSPHAAEIVRSLDALGLYRFLQPRADELFGNTPGFRKRYFDTFAAVGREDFKNLPGEAFSVLIRDYLEDAADWDGSGRGEETPEAGAADTEDAGPRSPAERYRSAFIMARKFVLPINPPRVEVDEAVRFLFACHGVTVKKTRFGERLHRDAPPRAAVRERTEGFASRAAKRQDIPGGGAGEKKTVPAPADSPSTPEKEKVSGKRRRRKKSEKPAL